MKKTKKTGYSENEKSDNVVLTRKELTSEISRIAGFKAPLKDKMVKIRYLIDRYFKFGSNEELLNANLP